MGLFDWMWGKGEPPKPANDNVKPEETYGQEIERLVKEAKGSRSIDSIINEVRARRGMDQEVPTPEILKPKPPVPKAPGVFYEGIGKTISTEYRMEMQALYANMRLPSADYYGQNIGEDVVDRMANVWDRYVAIGEKVNVPPALVALMHYRECSLSFGKHLHNGDSLKYRTVQVPAGRPPAPAQAPFSFEDSAVDCIKYKGYHTIGRWDATTFGWALEKNNGFGYREWRGIWSPYLWAGSNHYRTGYYVADGKWSATAVNKTWGCMPILRVLAQRGMVKL